MLLTNFFNRSSTQVETKKIIQNTPQASQSKTTFGHNWSLLPNAIGIFTAAAFLINSIVLGLPIFILESALFLTNSVILTSRMRSLKSELSGSSLEIKSLEEQVNHATQETQRLAETSLELLSCKEKYNALLADHTNLRQQCETQEQTISGKDLLHQRYVQETELSVTELKQKLEATERALHEQQQIIATTHHQIEQYKRETEAARIALHTLQVQHAAKPMEHQTAPSAVPLSRRSSGIIQSTAPSSPQTTPRTQSRSLDLHALPHSEEHAVHGVLIPHPPSSRIDLSHAHPAPSSAQAADHKQT